MDPRLSRISPHFVWSDFLGNHSVYSKGLVNVFDPEDEQAETKQENVRALCYEALEPLLELYGPMSLSYGYISPAVSETLVKYQDPAKPSHHRFDLGAAADICVHRFVQGEFSLIDDLYLPSSVVGSPIALAHAIDYHGIPYSRLITYSESPYICLAVSAKEVIASAPRKAFYENRYTGQPKVKPDYRQYSTPRAKALALEQLQTEGLAIDWQGAGYPTHHGGGFRQLHHTRVSKYTMVSDWLFNLKSISHGWKNHPSLDKDSVQDSFAAAGIVYDALIDKCSFYRLSIVEGYTSHMNRAFDNTNDWRKSKIKFAFVAPDKQFDVDNPDVDTMSETFAMEEILSHKIPGAQFFFDGAFIVASIDVDEVLNDHP